MTRSDLPSASRATTGVDTLRYGSLFSGIGGFDLGFDRAGLECEWQVEIDTAARSVLSRHWPDVPKFADVRDVGAHNLEPVDVITFGSPCQDLSVAGNRAGMAGERSGLFYEAIRIIRELRPAIAVWENVPGALSSNQGRDFGGAIDALADAGAVDICWRVLDARWFGVAQRRRRVFLVADFRGNRASEILFEPEGVPGHSQTRREAGKVSPTLSSSGSGTSRPGGQGAEPGFYVAGTLGGSSQSGGFRTTDLDNNGAFVPMARSQTTREGDRLDGESCTFVLQHAQIGRKDEAGPQGKGWQEGIAFTLDSRPTADVVAHSVSLRGRDGGATAELGGDIATALRASQGGGDKPHVLAIQQFSKDVLAGLEVLAFDWQSGGDVRHHVSEYHTSPLQVSQTPAVMQAMAVRRLTPTECERLQGFPDGHTAGQADSSRYRQLGNAVAVPCSEWIANRIASVLSR